MTFTEFELGRLYERRETRDQLLALAKITDDENLKAILMAWLQEVMDTLPERFIVTIEETYVRFE